MPSISELGRLVGQTEPLDSTELLGVTKSLESTVFLETPTA